MYAGQRARMQLKVKEPRVIDRPGKLNLPKRYRLESGPCVVGQIADEDDEAVPKLARALKTPIHQCTADSLVAPRRVDGEWPEQQRARLTDRDRPMPHRPGNETAVRRDKRELGNHVAALAQAMRGFRVSPRPERAIIEGLNGGGLVRRFERQSERGFEHWSGPEPVLRAMRQRTAAGRAPALRATGRPRATERHWGGTVVALALP